MFATLRYDQNSTLVEQAEYIMACTNCRARKLKCTGQKDGCNRCLSRSVECKYPEPAQGRGSRRAKASLNKANAALNTSTSTSHAATRSPTASRNPKAPTPPQGSHVRPRSQAVSNGASPVPSLSWTAGSLSSDSNDGSMFDNPMSSDVSMNEATDDFGQDLHFGNPDIFALDDPDSTDLMWTNFLESVGKQSENPVSRSSPEGDNFDAFSNFDHTSNTLFNLQSSPSSITSTTLSSSRPVEAAKQIKTSGGNLGPQQSNALVSLNDATSPTSNAQLGASEAIQQGLPDFFTYGMMGPSTPPSSPLSQAPCQCFTSALSLLETLTLGDSRSSPPTVACRLHLKKRALVQCNRLLDCQRCSGISSFMVLLMVLCEKMVSSYEEVLIILTEQYDRIRQQTPTKSSSSPSNGRPEASPPIQNEQRQMTVKDYDLDPDEEPCVFGGLAITQLKRLRDFLARAKTVLKGWSWDPHVAMLEIVEERVRDQLRKYSKKSDEHS